MPNSLDSVSGRSTALHVAPSDPHHHHPTGLYGFRVHVQGSGFMFRVHVQGSGFRVQGSGFKVQGSCSGFRVQGSGFIV